VEENGVWRRRWKSWALVSSVMQDAICASALTTRRIPLEATGECAFRSKPRALVQPSRCESRGIHWLVQDKWQSGRDGLTVRNVKQEDPS